MTKPTNTVGALLLLVAAAASVSAAAVVPSIEVTERGNIVLTVATGAQVLLKTVGPDDDLGSMENDGEPLVTLSLMEASLAALKAELLDQIATKTDTATFNALSDDVAGAAKVSHHRRWTATGLHATVCTHAKSRCFFLRRLFKQQPLVRDMLLNDCRPFQSSRRTSRTP
jgi:predicted transcriptional regulator